MHRLAWLVLASSLPGCTLFFDGPDRDQCIVEDTPAIAPAPLRDPENLTCQSFGGGCDPSCGPCPEVAEVAGLAPIPSWGICGSPCEGLDEATCATRSECRVVKDARCAIGLDCATDFLGCFPTDMAVDETVACSQATDGWTCSHNPGCTAFHRVEPCPFDAPRADCPIPFAFCMPEGRAPGHCFEPALCDIVAPPCPPGTTPGVIDGCYSGACIPDDLCEVPPPPMG